MGIYYLFCLFCCVSFLWNVDGHTGYSPERMVRNSQKLEEIRLSCLQYCAGRRKIHWWGGGGWAEKRRRGVGVGRDCTPTLPVNFAPSRTGLEMRQSYLLAFSAVSHHSFGRISRVGSLWLIFKNSIPFWTKLRLYHFIDCILSCYYRTNSLESFLFQTLYSKCSKQFWKGIYSIHWIKRACFICTLIQKSDVTINSWGLAVILKNHWSQDQILPSL